MRMANKTAENKLQYSTFCLLIKFELQLYSSYEQIV